MKKEPILQFRNGKSWTETDKLLRSPSEETYRTENFHFFSSDLEKSAISAFLGEKSAELGNSARARTKQTHFEIAKGKNFGHVTLN